MDARDGHFSRDEQRYLQRMRFMRLGYTVLQSYMSMVRSAATDVDFPNLPTVGQTRMRTYLKYLVTIVATRLPLATGAQRVYGPFVDGCPDTL